MQRAPAFCFVMRATQGLTVYGDGLTFQLQLQLVDSFSQTVLKLERIPPAKHASKCVMSRNTEGQFQEATESVDVGFGEAFNVGPAVGPADCATNRDSNHVAQKLIPFPIIPGVCQIDKACKKFQVSVFHNSPRSVSD